MEEVGIWQGMGDQRQIGKMLSSYRTELWSVFGQHVPCCDSKTFDNWRKYMGDDMHLKCISCIQ